MTDYRVDADDTATAVGSGDVPCLGTPRLLAWLEAETCTLAAPLLQPGRTSVGVRVELDHLAASPVGSTVSVSASVRVAGERRIDFDVTAVDPDTGRLLARGTVRRAVVERDTFLDRA